MRPELRNDGWDSWHWDRAWAWAKNLLESYSVKVFIYLFLFPIENQFPFFQNIYSLSSRGTLVFID